MGRPYLKKGNVRVVGPEDQRLETILVALQVERFLRLRPKVLGAELPRTPYIRAS
jgi:hypothetical protein